VLNVLRSVVQFVLFMFVGMLAFLELGRRVRWYQRAHGKEGASAGSAAVAGAVFALLGLLIAFIFSAAAGRFETRRNLAVDEANNIGTAYLRIDLLPADAQPALRELFRKWVDTRLAVYRALPDTIKAKTAVEQTSELQGQIWALCVASAQRSPAPAIAAQVFSAVNAMFDIANTRTWAMRAHTPREIFIMLAIAALFAALLAGYDMGQVDTRSWIHMILFSAVFAMAVFVIYDLEYPRGGFIRIDAWDQGLVDVRQSMH
jgi:hypothetical protein